MTKPMQKMVCNYCGSDYEVAWTIEEITKAFREQHPEHDEPLDFDSICDDCFAYEVQDPPPQGTPFIQPIRGTIH